MPTYEELDDRFHDFFITHRNAIRQYFQSGGMHGGQQFMLFHIREQPGMTQKQLARAMRVTAASVAVSIRRMETAGLVRREPDQADARAVRLFLTPAGEALDDECRKAKKVLAAVQFDGFTAGELEQLDCFLGRMTANMAKAPAYFPQKKLIPTEEEVTTAP